ncbi:MAG: N(5)-(carboxyethyl)ornithine synthase [Candidatus Cloacimonetes bacterium]|nr:N(5)-(carboxyethyl)ornithine synthase [Candidatus Cloacimonadota bacterium]
MKIGLIKPNFPNEKRVALLPEHIIDFENELIVENNFGEYMDIPNFEYENRNCIIKDRETILRECDVIFSLKLIQQVDYKFLRPGQMIIGWTHPSGSGAKFIKEQAIPKNLIIVDLDNIYPFIHYMQGKIDIGFLKPNFIWKNSYMAGFSSTMHAILAQGIVPNANTRVAILACGNVSQGAYAAISKFNPDIRLYYRKTMHEFKESIADFDIIINGIEMDNDIEHIVNNEEIKLLKSKCLLIDAAADAGRAIESTRYTSIDNPLYYENDVYFYVVNNSPSIFYRESSYIISQSFSKHIFKKNIKRFYALLK